MQTLNMFEVVRAKPKSGDPDGLRYYQRTCNTNIFESLKENRSCLVVLATGLGKTQVFSSVVRTWPGRVLVLCHREELINQAAKRLEQMCRERVEIEQGSLKSGRARIVVGSVQTVYRQDRLEALARKGGFSLVVVDEAHHYISETYRRPLDYFEGAKVLGVTATPDRGDGRALAGVFDDVAYTMELIDGVRAGYLVPLKGREVFIDEINLDSVSSRAGELAPGELDEQMVKGVEGVVKGMLKYCGEDKQGILFLPGVKSSVLAAARLNVLNHGCARSVDGKTPPEVRKKLFTDFNAGRFQILCNCMVATEGFDCPNVSVVGLARPTTSRSLYAQMGGRATRVLPGVVDRPELEGEHNAAARHAAIAASKKPSALIIDFTGKNSKHSLMTPADILGGGWDEPTKKLAKELTEMPENSEKTAEEILDEAAEQLANQEMTDAQIEAAAASIRSTVKVRSREFDPFATVGVSARELEVEAKFALEYGYKAPTPGQMEAFEKFGFKKEDIESLSRRAATKVLTKAFERRELKLASPGQLEKLSRYGVRDASIKSANANKALEYIKAHGDGKASTYDKFQLHEILFG